MKYYLDNDALRNYWAAAVAYESCNATGRGLIAALLQIRNEYRDKLGLRPIEEARLDGFAAIAAGAWDSEGFKKDPNPYETFKRKLEEVSAGTACEFKVGKPGEEPEAAQ